MKFDLHIHTKYSEDCKVKPEKIVEVAKKNGLNGIAITDHDNIKGWNHMIEAAKKFGLMLVLGEEVKIKDNNGNYEILGLFLDDQIKPGTFDEIVEQIKEQDGIACLPHPFDPFKVKFNDRDFLAKKLDAVEIFNARVLRPIYNEKAFDFAKKHDLGMTAGSDAHTEQEVGRGYLIADVNDLESLKKAILRGDIEAGGKTAIPPLRMWFSINQRIGAFR